MADVDDESSKEQVIEWKPGKATVDINSLLVDGWRIRNILTHPQAFLFILYRNTNDSSCSDE